MSTKPRFSNRLYRAELSHTNAGSPIIKIVPMNPNGPAGHHRQSAAFLYELELRSQEIDAQWVVSPEAYNDRITLELSTADKFEQSRTDQFAAKFISERKLG